MRPAPDDGRFGIEDVVAAAGMTHREVHYSVSRGYLTTALPSVGTGTPLRFSHDDVRRARVFAAARRAGLSTTVAARLGAVVLSGMQGIEVVPGVTVTVDEQRAGP